MTWLWNFVVWGWQLSATADIYLSTLCWNDWWWDQHSTCRLTSVIITHWRSCKYQRSYNNQADSRGYLYLWDAVYWQWNLRDTYPHFRTAKEMGIYHAVKQLWVFPRNDALQVKFHLWPVIQANLVSPGSPNYQSATAFSHGGVSRDCSL